MEHKFNDWVEERNYFTLEDKVLIALSGGVDSVVLTHLLNHLPNSIRPQLFLAHVNHHLREVSNIEQKYIEEWAAELELPLFVYEWSPDDQPETNIEQAARDTRYQFFEQVMVTEDIDYLVTAHHQDDQVETILMRLFEGKNVELLTGIPEISSRFNKRIIRPLLPFAKDELYAYAKKYKLVFFEDETNFEDIYYRNFIRTQIIPPLKENNHKFNEHLIAFKKELEELLEIRELQLVQLHHLKTVEADYQVLDYQELMEYPKSIQRAFIQEILQDFYLQTESDLKNTYIDLFFELMTSESVNKTIEFGQGVRVYKTYDYIYIYNCNTPPHFLESITNQELIVPMSEWLTLSEYEKIGLFEAGEVEIPPQAEVMDIEGSVELPLVARHRRDGDRMQVKGMNGTKKIKDIFIDEKVPLHLRDKKWIISDQTDKIIWLVSVRKAELPEKQSDVVPNRQLIYVNQEKI